MAEAKELTYDGRTQTMAAWAREMGISANTLLRRLQRGWGVERALTEKPVTRGRRLNVKRQITHEGRTLCLAEWAREAGLKPSTLGHRLNSGWSMQDALSSALCQRVQPAAGNEKLLTHQGRTQCVAAWAREAGINATTIFARLKRGWELERVLTTKPATKSQRPKPSDRPGPISSAASQELTYDGRTQILLDWAAEMNVLPITILSRLKRGWPVADAITRPE